MYYFLKKYIWKKTAEQFIKFRIKYIVNKMAYVIFK